MADEVWIGTALLHREHPDRADFSIAEIVDRVAEEGLHKPLRPGVQIHETQHCVANKRPNPGTYRMLYETHPYRGGKIVPERREIPEGYRYLLDWYHGEYDRKA